MKIERFQRGESWRPLIQWLFFAWIVGIGVRFALFVRHFESDGATPLVSRPPGVEGFLPIGALVSLKHWLVTGTIDRVHPAALLLLLTFIAMSLLARKSFCSWLCPVGTLSEAAWKLGQRVFKRSFRIWDWLDLPLRGIKYLLLFFFVKIVFFDMPAMALGGFLKAPYWAISDVKMLHFFLNMSATALAVIAVLSILSVFYQNFWCRYLCPYGALLGFFSMLSPLKIRRDQAACIDCGKCSRACPSRLPVHRKNAISSPECTGCLSCSAVCPTSALVMAPPLHRKLLAGWRFPALVVGLFVLGVGAGMVSGHWETSLTYEDYQRLIPMARMLGH
ncbi:4Fe-4S binding protein [Trichloromonas sp.]|uniref:4Fe-4S binding protein n=1 Tax=Trichloromonas sp. TaxID=3069249 RepID=UPI003D81AF15